MRYTVAFLAVLAGCGGKPPESAAPDKTQQPLRILFHGRVETRQDDGSYLDDDIFYNTTHENPADPVELDCKVNGNPLYVALISAKPNAAEIRIEYRGEKRDVSIDQPTEVLFDAGATKVFIQLATASLSPFAVDDAIFKSVITACKIDNGISPVPIRKQKVLAKCEMTSEQAERLRKVLTDYRYLA